MPTSEIPPSDTPDSDEARLHSLGYAQELRRSLSGFSNFAVSFTIISILSGCLTLYGFGMKTGGPAAMIWGWPLVGVFVVLVGLGMAEVCSSYPTAGGLYYWAAKLAKRNAPAWAWFTGWFNLVGQVAVTAGIDFGAALFLNAFLDLQFGFAATPGHTVLLLAIILLVHALLNTFGVRVVAILNTVSVWWHLLGVLAIVIVLAVVPDKHQDASFVFGEFVNQTGWSSPVYVFLIGLLLAQYTLTGYDASAHMTEETRGAAVAGPRGIVMSILVSLAAGWVLLIGLTFAIQDYDGAASSATGVPPAQVFIDAVGLATGKVLLLICIGAQLFCGMAAVTGNSRMIYAFARDGAIPGSRVWHRINKRTRTPTNSVWLAAVGAFLLAVPYLWSYTAYAAVTSIAVVGLYTAYVIPIFLRVRAGDDFKPGPWHLGRWGRPIGTIATIWVGFIFVLFMLPQVYPVTWDSLNYTPIAFAVLLGGAALWWIVSARKWFTGPKVQGSAAELAAVERDLAES
ncbi:amino acid permease [Actinokineospora cianjurensis]|uniref:Amino acid/polyamine/organocation transporter (APC superfamily) n=1 Tax=Actinokineospora cianjurensis TaxID=585224 RepID=A0A421AWP5_9PSEU|nr:amino acid permease [Actinokineospora cianjurensis]RLK54154.1 amino acid/polyamine/organocation transporter (APC superfamily) [Actinokineospora cianjurensis]